MNLQPKPPLPPGTAPEEKKPDRLPVYFSAFVLPGAGQFIQRRWISAVIYSVGFVTCFVIILARAVKLWIGMVASASDNKPFAEISIYSFLWPLIISIVIYILSIVEAMAVYRKDSRLQASRKMDDRLKQLSILALAIFTMSATGSQGQVSDIFQAVRSNDVSRIDRLIEKKGWDIVSATNPDGITPLHLAAALNSYGSAALLISAGANVNARTPAGFTPLHWAANKNAVDTARLLIKSGADVNARANSGITPLHWAANRNATNIVSMLLAVGADVTATTDSGFTPLHWAMMKKSNEAAHWLAFKIASDQIDTERRKEALAPPAETNLQETIIPESEPETAASTNQAPAAPELKGKTLAVAIGLNEALLLVWVEPLKLWVSKYETTNAQFKRFRPDHSSMFRETFSLNDPDQPVVYVSWNEANDFCAWLNKNFSGSIPRKHEFRLPTEKEWIACARCETERIYPWGNEWPPKYGNFSDLTARKQFSTWSGIKGYNDGFAVSCPVSESGSNEWNIFGLAGNVWEWCSDWFDSSRKYKVRHGGSWDFDDQKRLRIDYRGFDRPDTRDDTIGFRVVVAPKGR